MIFSALRGCEVIRVGVQSATPGTVILSEVGCVGVSEGSQVTKMLALAYFRVTGDPSLTPTTHLAEDDGSVAAGFEHRFGDADETWLSLSLKKNCCRTRHSQHHLVSSHATPRSSVHVQGLPERAGRTGHRGGGGGARDAGGAGGRSG